MRSHGTTGKGSSTYTHKTSYPTGPPETEDRTRSGTWRTLSTSPLEPKKDKSSSPRLWVSSEGVTRHPDETQGVVPLRPEPDSGQRLNGESPPATGLPGPSVDRERGSVRDNLNQGRVRLSTSSIRGSSEARRGPSDVLRLGSRTETTGVTGVKPERVGGPVCC